MNPALEAALTELAQQCTHNIPDECKRLFPLGKAYHEPGFFEGNVEMWRALKAAAYAARSAKKGEHGFWESSLGDLLSLGG